MVILIAAMLIIAMMVHCFLEEAKQILVNYHAPATVTAVRHFSVVYSIQVMESHLSHPQEVEGAGEVQ